MPKCKDCKKQDLTIVEALQKQMEKEGYITKESITEIAKTLNKPESEVYGVATFYSQFSFSPKAKYNICVCTGTTCFVLGADKILEEIKHVTKTNENETSEDGKWNISTARCLGCFLVSGYYESRCFERPHICLCLMYGG